jgi:hypothetical protein
MALDGRNLLAYKIHDHALWRGPAIYLGRCPIDMGYATKPHLEILAKYVTEQVGVDHVGSQQDRSNVGLDGTTYRISSRDGALDCAPCSARVSPRSPRAALRECSRVLGLAAVAISSARLIWHVHEAPRDFFRNMRFGLEFPFKGIGFEIIEHNALPIDVA